MAKKTTRPAAKKTTKATKTTGARKTATASKRSTNPTRALNDPTRTERPPVAPYLAVNDANAAIAWYQKVFNAKLDDKRPMPDGKIMHAQLTIGGGIVWLSDIMPGTNMVDASRTGPSVTVSVWNKNADKFWANAVANGAKVTLPIDDMFWGDRYGQFVDPFGHAWSVSTRSKLSRKALEAKAAEAMKGYASMSQQ